MIGCKSDLAYYTCATNADCQGQTERGVCEPEQVCSFSDSSCPDGRRYGSASGILSEHCVVADVPDAGAVLDAGFVPDAAPETGAVLTVVSELVSREVCGFGGSHVDVGGDDNGDGVLELEEVDFSGDVCLEQCAGAWVELVKDFTTMGEFETLVLDDGELSVTGAHGGEAKEVSVREFGLGVVGGGGSGGSGAVGLLESLTFLFSEPAFNVSYEVVFVGFSFSDRFLRSYSLDGEILGQSFDQGEGMNPVFTPRPETPMLSFREEEQGGRHRVATVSYFVCREQ